MKESEILKMSPKPGFLYDIRPREVSMTRKAANKREYLLTKNDRSPAMNHEELLKSVEAVSAPNEADIANVLSSNNVSETGIGVANVIARLLHAYSDELDSNVLLKSLVAEPAQQTANEITKSDLDAVPAAVRAKVERALEENSVLKTRVDEIAKSFEQARDEKEFAEFVQKASGFSRLSVETTELASVMKSVYKACGEDTYNTLMTVLNAVNNVADAAEGDIMKSHGSAAEGEAGDDVARADTLAREIVKSENVAFSEALLRVLRANPELEKAYRG